MIIKKPKTIDELFDYAITTDHGKIHIKNDIQNINQYDGIIIVNNHYYFSRMIMTYLKLNKDKKKKMIFDSWSMLSEDYIKKLNWEYYNL